MNWAVIDPTILGLPLLAGLLVLLTHVPLGTQVLARGIVFIDLAIAQIAGLGVITANALGWADSGLGVQLAALSAALIGAALLSWTERRLAHQQEALIGVLFVVAACLGILLLAGNPHGGEKLKDLLVGQILWVGWREIGWLAGATVLVLLGMRLGAVQRLGGFGFYALFSVAVTASVQLVGVYLVFSSLIIPALATRHRGPSNRLVLAYAVGAGGFVLGLLLSALFDLPAGAVIVCAIAACGVLAACTRGSVLTPRVGTR